MSRYFLLLNISIIYLALFSACGRKEKAQTLVNAPVSVNTHLVKEEAVIATDNYPGTVVPLKEVELRPQVAGYITDIFIKDGQKVSEGQKLYEIDRRKYNAAYNQAQANLQSALANQERARKDQERYERLLEHEAIARQQVDYARAAFKTASSQVDAARAQIASVSTDLNYSVINAPFNGTIGISQVRVGSQVSPGQTLLNTISSDDPIAVDFVVNEKEIERFQKLYQGNSNIDSTFTILLAGDVVYPHYGKITAIDRSVDRQTGTITIRLSFPNPKRTLIAGMTVNIKVLNQDIGKQVVIPYKAVTEQMGEYFVFVVRGDSVVQQKLHLGTGINEKVVVREGLAEGETIVTEGIQKLRQGSRIQTGILPNAGVKK